MDNEALIERLEHDAEQLRRMMDQASFGGDMGRGALTVPDEMLRDLSDAAAALRAAEERIGHWRTQYEIKSDQIGKVLSDFATSEASLKAVEAERDEALEGKHNFAVEVSKLRAVIGDGWPREKSWQHRAEKAEADLAAARAGNRELNGVIHEHIDDLAAARSENDRLREVIVQREARRLELLDFVQEETGTGWTCDNCGYSTYHAFNKECADCGTEFPFANLMAFKLHASGTDNAEYLDRARALLSDQAGKATT
jgi:rubrerythrin